MRIPTLVVFLVLLLFALVAALNWSAVTALVSLDLLVATVELPVGLVLLGGLALVSALLISEVVYLQSVVMRDARRHNKALQTRLAGADSADAARAAELRTLIGEEFNRLGARVVDAESRLKQHIGMVGEDLRAAVQTSGNGVAAHIGELEDRLERAGAMSPPNDTPVLLGGSGSTERTPQLVPNR